MPLPTATSKALTTTRRMQKPVVLAVYVVSGVHAFLGLLNLVVGVISSIRAEVWRAHSVSPIWSGGFVSITPKEREFIIRPTLRAGTFLQTLPDLVTATEGAFFISAQLSSDAVSALRKVQVLI